MSTTSELDSGIESIANCQILRGSLSTKMKVLLYFADMVAMHFLRFDASNPATDSLERFLRQLGGTCFTNCHTPCPDTPRSLATIFTGLSSDDNGCNRRDLWPGLGQSSVNTSLFQVAIENSFLIKALFSKTETSSGRLVSSNISKHITIRHTLDSLINELRNESCSDQLIFIQDNDCHFTIDDRGGTQRSHTLGASRVARNLMRLFESHEPDSFDLIILFSDHGFRPKSFLAKSRPLSATYPGKSNILLQIRRRGEVDFSLSDEFHSTTQLGSLILSILSSRTIDDPVLDFKRDHLQLPFIIEDYRRNDTSLGSYPDLWTVIFPEFVYRESSTGLVEITSSQRVKSQIPLGASVEAAARNHLLSSSRSYQLTKQLKESSGQLCPPISTYLDGSLRKRPRFGGMQMLSRFLRFFDRY